MSGNYANSSARRRRARGESTVNPNNSGANYSDMRQQQMSQQQMSQQQMSHNQDNYRVPPGKIHIQHAFDVLIQRVNSIESRVVESASNQEQDYTSHISLLFEKMNSLERRFNTLLKNNEELLNTENLEDNNVLPNDKLVDDTDNNEESLQNESTFNFVNKEDLTKAVSSVVKKEEFNEIMSSVGKDIGDITERTMHLNELLLQVQNGNIMLNSAIATIKQEMKNRYVVDKVSSVKKEVTSELTLDKEVKTNSNLKGMNKDEISKEVKRELSNVEALVDSGDEDAASTNDEANSNE